MPGGDTWRLLLPQQEAATVTAVATSMSSSHECGLSELDDDNDYKVCGIRLAQLWLGLRELAGLVELMFI